MRGLIFPRQSKPTRGKMSFENRRLNSFSNGLIIISNRYKPH